MSHIDVFTTGQVARHCKVAPRTVSKWFDSGQLKGYRLPGSLDRRIPRPYLIKFLDEHGMPKEGLQSALVVVSRDTAVINCLKGSLSPKGISVFAATNSFDAGLLAKASNRGVLVLDIDAGLEQVGTIFRQLPLANLAIPPILMGIVNSDSPHSCYRVVESANCFKRPFSPEHLAARIVTVLGLAG